MDLAHVLLLALLQGVTELFPVSSLGHTVLIPGVLGWNETLSSPTFVPLVVALHIGTATALLTFFWRDWVALLRAGLRVTLAGRFTRDVDPQGYGRQLALVVVGTIPAGLIGLMFQHPLEKLFSQPILVAAFLTANGAVLLAAERLGTRQRLMAQSAGIAAAGVSSGISMGATAAHGGTAGMGDMPGHWSESASASLEQRPGSGTMAVRGGAGASASADDPAVLPGFVGKSLDDMSFLQAAIIGFAQSFALLPGISRSGATMVAGLSNGLSHEAAARFSFLLATPIIAAAGLLELPKLFTAGGNTLTYALMGGVLAGISAYLSVRFLMKYFETKSLDPFAWYCIGAGILAFLYFAAIYFHVLP
jgi:undecaprenyl-diphosphatase